MIESACRIACGSRAEAQGNRLQQRVMWCSMRRNVSVGVMAGSTPFSSSMLLGNRSLSKTGASTLLGVTCTLDIAFRLTQCIVGTLLCG